MTLTTPRWLTRLAGPHALSVPAWLLVSATSVAWSIALLTSSASLSLIEAAAWGVLAAVALGATWWVANKTWMRGGSPTRRAWLILPTYVLAASIRSVIPLLVSSSPEALGLFPFAIGSMTIMSVAATLAVDSYRELEVNNGRLAAIRDALAESESRAQVEAATLRASAHQAITAAIEQALAGEPTNEDRALRLRRVSDDVVRPLSHALAGQYDEATLSVPAQPRRDLRTLCEAILTSQPIRPIATASLVTVMSLGIIFMVAGVPRVFATAAIFWVALSSLLWLVQRLPWKRLPVSLGIALLPLAFAGTGLLTLALLRLLPTAVDGIPRAPFLVAIITLIAGSLVAVLAGVTRQQRQLEEALIREGHALVATRRATQARIRRDRRHLARILHGIVQPRIVARSLQLGAPDPGPDIDGLTRELDDLLSQDTAGHGPTDVVRALSDIEDVWSGSKAIVEVTAPEELNAALAMHPAAARALVDVTCEAVNNAILRAGASRIHAVVTRTYDALTVAVTNDVRLTNQAPSGGPGLGTALFDELTDEWSLTTAEGRAEFTALISLPSHTNPAMPDNAHHEDASARVIADKFSEAPR